jgi:preprotein translocase subunit SecY
MRALLQSFRNLFRIPEVRRRIFWTLGLLAVYRVGCHVPLPGVDPEAVRVFADEAARSMGGLWSVLQMFSGEAIGRLALFSLGIAPYITASIAVQLLTKVVPSLETLSKEGPRGRRELKKLTIYATVPLCLLEAGAAAWRLSGTPLVHSGGLATLSLVTIGLTAGSMFVVWLGDQITERGVGNGASVLIMAGIVVRLPAVAADLVRRCRDGAVGADAVLIVLAFALAAVVATVFISLAQRRIPLQRPAHVRGRRLELGGRNYLPIQMLTAGVMPIIFASTLLALPSMAGLVPGLAWLGRTFQHGGFPFTVVYVAAIVFLSFFWTYAFLSPVEIAQQLRESGSAVPGFRPGETTVRHLNAVLSRLTLCGAVALALLALLPGFATRALGLGPRLEAFVGGSGLLIVVGVGLDLIRKLESSLLLHHYRGFLGNLK